MTLEQGYFISQIIAAIVLVASILFLALQVRQNSRILERTMLEDFRKIHATTFLDISRSRDVADFFVKSGTAYNDLDELDKTRADFSALWGISTFVQTIRARQAGFIQDKLDLSKTTIGTISSCA